MFRQSVLVHLAQLGDQKYNVCRSVHPAPFVRIFFVCVCGGGGGGGGESGGRGGRWGGGEEGGGTLCLRSRANLEAWLRLSRVRASTFKASGVYCGSRPYTSSYCVFLPLCLIVKLANLKCLMWAEKDGEGKD